MKTKKELIDFISQVEFNEKGSATNLEVRFPSEDTFDNTIEIDTKWFLSGTAFYRIKQKQYKPYTEAKPEWVGKEIKDKKLGDIAIITAITYTDNWFVDTTISKHHYTLQEMLDNFVWEDGTPFGEEI